MASSPELVSLVTWAAGLRIIVVVHKGFVYVLWLVLLRLVISGNLVCCMVPLNVHGLVFPCGIGKPGFIIV